MKSTGAAILLFILSTVAFAAESQDSKQLLFTLSLNGQKSELHVNDRLDFFCQCTQSYSAAGIQTSGIKSITVDFSFLLSKHTQNTNFSSAYHTTPLYVCNLALKMADGMSYGILKNPQAHPNWEAATWESLSAYCEN